jgi:protein-disulfide isomerase
MKKLFFVFGAIALMSACTPQSQTATIPTPTAVNAVAGNQDTPTTSGAFEFVLPADWFSFPGRGGGIFLSNRDLNNLPSADYPENTVIISANVITIDMLGDALMTDSPTPSDVLGVILAQDFPDAVIEEVTFNGQTLAKADTPTQQYAQNAYLRFVDENNFIIASIVGVGAETLGNQNETILNALTSFELDFSAPFAEEPIDYSDLEVGLSPEGFPQLGNADASVTIYEISSFDCPHCAEFHELGFPAVLDQVRAGTVRFVYVPIFGTGGISGGDNAARAALCAGEQGKFFEYHDGVFAWQGYGGLAFSPQRLENGATNLGLDIEQWNACLTSETTTQILRDANTFARSTPGFQGTPTVLLNGQIVNWLPVPGFVELMRRAATTEATAEATVEATAEATSNP